MREALVINKKDNVATALGDLKKGIEVDVNIGGQEEVKKVKLRQRIPFGHKFAIKGVKKGEDILKYGEKIGKATKNIDVGQYVHIHNIESTRGRGDK